MKNLMFLELLEYWHRSMGNLGANDPVKGRSRQLAWFSLGLTAAALGLIGSTNTAIASEATEPKQNAVVSEATISETTVSEASISEATTSETAEPEAATPLSQLSQASESDPLFIEPVEDAPTQVRDVSDEEDRWIKRDQLGTPSTADPNSDFVGGTSYEERQDLGRPPSWSDYDGEVEIEPITNSASTAAGDFVPAIEFLQVERTPADGRTTALIQGQVVDRDGSLYTEDVVITLRAAAGTRPARGSARRSPAPRRRCAGGPGAGAGRRRSPRAGRAAWSGRSRRPR